MRVSAQSFQLPITPYMLKAQRMNIDAPVDIGGHSFTVVEVYPPTEPTVAIARLRTQTGEQVWITQSPKNQADPGWRKPPTEQRSPCSICRVHVANPAWIQSGAASRRWLDGVWTQSGFLIDTQEAVTAEWDALYLLFEISQSDYSSSRTRQDLYEGRKILTLCETYALSMMSSERARKAMEAAEIFAGGALASLVMSLVANWPDGSIDRQTRALAALCV